MRADLETRFWSKVDRSGDCWIWEAGKNRDGYGQITVKGRQMGAHVVAYQLAHGAVPVGCWVLHHCDNPSCVRPEHLYAGTHADNVRDRDVRGRTLAGEQNGNSSISDSVVAEVRTLYSTGAFTQNGLARRFGVSQAWVSNVVRGVWRQEAAA